MNKLGQDFDTWMERVDAYCVKITGLRRDDFPDMAYWDSWKEDVTPHEMLVEILDYNGYAN